MSSPEAGPSGSYCRPKSPTESHHSASNSSLNTESTHSSISLRYASSCQSIPYDSFDEEVDLDAVENWLKDELKEEEEMERRRQIRKIKDKGETLGGKEVREEAC